MPEWIKQKDLGKDRQSVEGVIVTGDVVYIKSLYDVSGQSSQRYRLREDRLGRWFLDGLDHKPGEQVRGSEQLVREKYG